jgi:hypothetical protein
MALRTITPYALLAARCDHRNIAMRGVVAELDSASSVKCAASNRAESVYAFLPRIEIEKAPATVLV